MSDGLNSEINWAMQYWLEPLPTGTRAYTFFERLVERGLGMSIWPTELRQNLNRDQVGFGAS